MESNRLTNVLTVQFVSESGFLLYFEITQQMLRRYQHVSIRNIIIF